MATPQPYTPQPGAQSGAASRGKFAPIQGAPEVVAIAAIPGEMAPSEFGPSEVRYRLADGRTWYVPQIVADEINLRLAPRQQFEVLKFGRGKTDLRITPLPPYVPPYEAPPSPPPYETPPPPPPQRVAAPVAPPVAEGPKPQGLRFMGAYKDAIDVLLEAKEYAQRKGLALEIRCEDVRALAATIMIDAQKGGCR